MISYFYDCYTILNKVYSDGAFLKQAINDTTIEEKNRRLIVKTCYGVLDKDIELSYEIHFYASKTPKLAIRTILKIAMYAIRYLEKPSYAVIDNAVELTKKLGKKGAGGFVNAFLRRFISEASLPPKDEIERLSVQFSYPIFAVNLLQNAYGKEEAEKIMASENKKTALRFREDNGEQYLTARSVLFERSPFERLFLATGFSRDAGYDQGIYTFQSIGSAAICAGIEPCDNLLDACAAPGGKSVNLAEKCKNVLATDIYPHRVELIRQYAARMKVKNVQAQISDATCFQPDFVEAFDAVLCDVPCSGFGVVNDNPDIKLNRSEQSLAELNQTQRAILENCSAYVKKGGYLYYSTCSVFPSENEEIVRDFLLAHNDFCSVAAESPLPHIKKGDAMQFLPHISLGGGYFFAKMKRL